MDNSSESGTVPFSFRQRYLVLYTYVTLPKIPKVPSMTQQMQAASLIKLYIMGAVYEDYDSLSATYGKDKLDDNLNSMITVSDNDAANTLVNYLGGGDDAAGMARVNKFCQDHGYTSTSMGRLLLADNSNGDNYTSVKDCGKFLKTLSD